MVGRTPRSDQRHLDALLDQRDELRIQIHFDAESGKVPDDKIQQARAQLLELDERIDSYWKSVAFILPRGKPLGEERA